MRVAFGKKLGGMQRTALLNNAVYEELIFTPEQDHVPAADILDRSLPDQGDILRPHPRLHAGAVNAQGNPAMPLQRVRNSRHVVRAAFPADPTGIRSEEHTSELQSQSNIVCRLLLEKKYVKKSLDLENYLDSS